MSGLRSYVGAFTGQQQQFVIALDQHLDSIAVNGGGKVPRFVDDPNQQPTQTAPPPACALSVIGIDGKFRWIITNPQNVNPQSVAQMRAQLAQGMNLNGAVILHNVQSATDSNFNNSSSLLDYGITPDVFGQDQRPNETRFFRVRSSFDGQNFNDWQIFSSAQTCGPVGVQSGFMRSPSIAPRSPLNSTNNATVDSVVDGGTDDIRVYGAGGVGSAFSRFDGQGNAISTAGAIILGAAQDTDYAVVWSTVNLMQAFPTATQYLKTIADALFYIATTHTVKADGTGGIPGGGGTTAGGGAPGSGSRKLPQL
ncbi:MAG TPA: hypothetical protein VGQ12_07595 [Candidatus Angelobacter sp.]|jgi:hypothetical protein|nr:hypothetical protein [Candidatus Angelobacter sp.]